MELLATSQFHFCIYSVEVSQKHIFHFKLNEEGRAVISVIVCNSCSVSTKTCLIFILGFHLHFAFCVCCARLRSEVIVCFPAGAH
jgi:hypothetical protein